MTLRPSPIKPERIAELADRFQPPPTLSFYDLTCADYTLRTALSIPKNPKALILLAPGLKESIEKYYETIRFLNDADYAVAIIDWRGQGGSPRYYPKQPHKRGAQSFTRDRDDFIAFSHEVKKHSALDQLKTFILAHSMGSNIACHAAMIYPDIAEKMALSAPMFGISLPCIGMRMASVITAFINNAGLGHIYAPGHANWSPLYEKAGIRFLTLDPERQKVQTALFTQNTHITLGGVTWRWLHKAINACKTLRLSRIQCPVIIGMAEKDTVVCNNHIKQAGEKHDNITVFTLPDARHEIMMERDEIRNRFLQDTLRFFKA